MVIFEKYSEWPKPSQNCRHQPLNHHLIQQKMIAISSPCEGTFWQPFPIRGSIWTQVTMTFDKHWKFWIFVIPNDCHLQNLPYPKGKKIGRQWRPYLRVFTYKSKENNILFANFSPCEGTFWQPFPIRGPFWTQVTMTFDKHWKLAARLESRQWRRCFFYLLWTPSDRKRWRSSSCSLSRLQQIWI